MRNFVIFFDEKEGTSPLMRLLENFPQIHVVRQGGGGWEPFDRHTCGVVDLNTLDHCLRHVFDSSRRDMRELNQVYSPLAQSPLAPIVNECCVGFKMRFRRPNRLRLFRAGCRATGIHRGSYLREALRIRRLEPFYAMMRDILRDLNVVVFLAVRQDILRWALSKYHGDGSGRSGHLQFKLAANDIRPEDLPKIHVQRGRFRRIIKQCERAHAAKRAWKDRLEADGITVYPLLYERFLEDRVGYFRDLLTHLDVSISQSQILSYLSRGAFFKKVHSHNISEFVENHEEVLDLFGGRFQSWAA